MIDINNLKFFHTKNLRIFLNDIIGMTTSMKEIKLFLKSKIYIV